MHHRTRLRRTLVPATALGLGLAVLAPVAAQADPAGSAPTVSDVSASMTMWGSSTWYGGGQFVVTNDSAAPADWSLTFRVPSGTFQNHSDWNVRATVSGDRVTLTPKGGKLASGQSEYVSFGIEGDGTDALQPVGCALDGATVAGCDADGEPGDQLPTAPTDVRADRVHSRDAIVQWEPSTDDDVTAYTVTLRDAAGHVLREEQTDRPVVSHLLKGLAEGTEYQASVLAHDAQGESAESENVRFTTTVNQAPTAPTDLRMTRIEAERAILQWELATDDEYVVGYHATLRDEDGRIVRVYIGQRNHVSRVLDRLQPGTTYQVSVHAYDGSTNGAESETISFTTAS